MNRKIGNPAQLCEAVRVTVSEGPGRGAELINVSNGKLHFAVNVTNCLDILRLWHEGTNIGFLTKNGLYNVPDEFGRTFPAGLLYTCGLDNIGAREGFRIHGRLHSVPASIKELKADENGVRIVGEIRLTELFGENIVVERTIETAYDSGKIGITDKIRNDGFRDEQYCVLYHVNAGYPLVDEGTVIEGEFAESIARTPWAEKNKDRMFIVDAPCDNMEEMVYFHRQTVPRISIYNAKIGKRFTLEYSLDTLPFINEWKSMGSGDYVIGLEPATSWLDGYVKLRTLRPQETAVNKITIEITEN